MGGSLSALRQNEIVQGSNGLFWLGSLMHRWRLEGTEKAAHRVLRSLFCGLSLLVYRLEVFLAHAA